VFLFDLKVAFLYIFVSSMMMIKEKSPYLGPNSPSRKVKKRNKVKDFQNKS